MSKLVIAVDEKECSGHICVKMMWNHFFKFSRRTYSSISEAIIVSRRNDKAILQFNRPEKLNAMSLEMQTKLSMCLLEFERDPSVSAIILKGNEVGFSAGGDVVQFVQLLESDKTYFYKGGAIYYRGLLRLAECKKPVISLADKICMGGGAATAFLSSHPVVTERTVFAMPEVFIGFYPNVGANYFLVRLPNNLGMWIGLTGRRLFGSDIIHSGLSKHYVKSADLNLLEDALVNLERPDSDSVSSTIAQFQQKCNDWQINPNKVEQLFSGSSVEEIIENLKSDNTEFSAKILQQFSTLSPTALKLTFNLFRESQLKNYSKSEALSADFSLFKNFFGESDANINDFKEGIRSVLIDKNHKPNWIPNTLEQVDDKRLISYFTTNVTDIRASSP